MGLLSWGSYHGAPIMGLRLGTGYTSHGYTSHGYTCHGYTSHGYTCYGAAWRLRAEEREDVEESAEARQARLGDLALIWLVPRDLRLEMAQRRQAPRAPRQPPNELGDAWCWDATASATLAEVGALRVPSGCPCLCLSSGR